MPEIANLYATVGVDTSRFQAGMAGVDARMRTTTSSMRAMESTTSRFGGMLKSVGRAAAMGAGFGLSLAAAEAVRSAASFETSMAKIVGLVGVSRSQVASMGPQVKAMAKDFGKSGTEAADALFFITSAGLRGKAATDVLNASLKASAIGLGDVATIADLATSATNAYGSANLPATKATDVLTAAVREGKLEAGELAGSMGKVLPIASAMGVSFDQVGATFAALSRTGTNAAEAATQIRGILSKLLRPTKMANDTLAEYGLSAEALRKQVKEKGLLSVLQTLTNTFGDNEEAQAAVFGDIRALSGVMDLMGKNTATTRKIFESMKDTTGATDKAFQEIEQTAGFKMQKALARTRAAMLELGEAVLPAVAGIATAFGGLVSALSPLTSAFQAVMAGIGKVASVVQNSAVAMTVLKSAVVGLVSIKLAQWAMKGAAALRSLTIVTAVSSAMTGMGTALRVATTGFQGVSAASVGLAPGMTAAAAGMGRFSMASRVAGRSLATLGRGLVSAVGGWPMLIVGATAAIATAIGGDLIASFRGGASAADLYAAAQRRAADATRALASANSAMVSSVSAVAQAESMESAAKVRAAAATRAKNEALRAHGRDSAQYRAASKAAKDADVELASAMAGTDSARQQSTEAIKKQVQATVTSGQSFRQELDAHRRTVAGVPPLIEKSSTAYQAWAVVANNADKSFMRSNETVKDSQKQAARQATQLSKLGPEYADAAKAADRLAKAKTPEGYSKALSDLTTALGGTADEAAKAAGEVDSKIAGMAGGPTKIAAVEGEVAAGLQRILDNTVTKVGEINAAARKMMDRSSPVVADTIAASLDNIAAMTDAKLAKMEAGVAGRAGSINAAMRRSIDPQSLIGSFSAPPGLRDLTQQLHDLGVEVVAIEARRGKKLVTVDGMSEAINLSRQLELNLARLNREQAKEKPDKTRVKNLKARISSLRGRGLDVQAQLAEVVKGREGVSGALRAALDSTRNRLQAELDNKYGDVAVKVGARWQIQPGQFTQLQRRIDGELKKVEESAKARGTAIEQALRGKLVDKLDQLGADFAGKVRALQGRVSALTALEDPTNLTPAELALKQAEDAATAEDKARAMSEAQAALSKAVKEKDAEAIREAQQRIADLQRQDRIDQLRKEAEAERAERDKNNQQERESIEEAAQELRDASEAAAQQRRDDIASQGEADRLALQQQQQAEQDQLNNHINQLEKEMDRIPSILFQSKKRQGAELVRIRNMFKANGSHAGRYFANNLSKELGKVDGKIIQVLATKVRDLLQLNSPAKEGPLSTIDTWWKAMPETLASGVDPGDLDAVAQSIAAPKLRGSAARSGGGAVINVSITDQTFAGMSREQADRVARDLQAALDRQVRLAI